MNAKELARQKAEQLHTLALSHGDDPWNILNLVKSEIKRQGLEAYGLKNGDSQLKGARASYNSQTDIILYENSASEFEQAFLIGHELAHIVLEGNNEDSETFEIYPECTIENAQVGVDRVIDYGSRERREVRMDIFAREFLIPRYMVLQWHLNENLTSIDIAEKLKAPLDVVQQQLIDALLLPKVNVTEIKEETNNIKLDSSQEIAVKHQGSPFQLQAGPGTGKTFTLVKRIERLLSEGADPQSILVLTFSNKAAEELIKRVANKKPKEAAAMWIGTFHSFGLDIVNRFFEYLDRPKEPRLVDKVEAIDLLEDEFPRLPLIHFRNLYDPTLIINEMLSAISRAKDEVADAKHYRALSEKMLEQAGEDLKLKEQAEKCIEVAIFFEKYEEILKNSNTIDFGDLVSMPVSLLETNKDVRTIVSKRHKHILVDEYQDVNRASVRLLKTIAGKGNNLWVVGDSRQSIYRFRGASSINMIRFSSDFPGAKIEQLEMNYRSSEEIVETFKEFSGGMKASEKALPLTLHAQKGKNDSDSIPEFIKANTSNDEVVCIAESIQSCFEKEKSYKTQAVLCASNNRLSEIASGLESLGIPVLHLGNLFERGEIKTLLSLLSLLVDGRASGIINLAAGTKFPIDIQDVQHISESIKQQNCKPLNWCHSINEIKNISEQSKKSLSRLASLYDDIDQYEQPWSILSSIIIDRLEIGKEIYQTQNIKKQLEGIAIWQLLNLCKRTITGKSKIPIQRLLSYIRRLILLNDDRDLRQLPSVAKNLDAVKLMTIHGSKGLEFNVVHIPSLVATGLPRSNRSPMCIPPDGLIDGMDNLSGREAIKYGHDEEEECIFFVALSRAKNQLILYAFSKLLNGNNRSRSKFLDRIISKINTLENNIKFNEYTYKPIIVDWHSKMLFTDKQIGLYQRCPRSFFYTHIVKCGGKKTETTFMQMHNAVQETLDWLKNTESIDKTNQTSLDNKFEEIWMLSGPIEHGYADDYKMIGFDLIKYYLKSREGWKTAETFGPILLSLPEGDINIIPDEILISPYDKSLIIRRIRTGKKRSDEFDNIEYSILQAALEQSYGQKTEIEAVHLTSETCETFSITPNKFIARINKAKESFTRINKGYFPQNKTRSCPNCPHFFICGDIPKGKLQK